MAPAHIAILDDEPEIRALLSRYLSSQGYRVTELRSGSELLAAMSSDTPAIVLLDLGLPGEDGFAIARQLREHFRCGLIIVTGRGDAVDKVVGLEVGADDYVTKPFDLRELAARIKAVLRRTAASAGLPMAQKWPADVAPPASEADRARFEFAGWLFDTGSRTLRDPAGREVALTSGEFDLLAVLVHHPGRVLSRDFILERTRGRNSAPFDRTIDVQIGRLRRKMEADSERPELIKSVRGAGYVLVPQVVSC